VQVPGDVALNFEPLTIKQPAVPAAVTAYVTAPLPEPPDMSRMRSVPYVPLIEERTTGVCADKEVVVTEACELSEELR
jgi:hypothetical protein